MFSCKILIPYSGNLSISREKTFSEFCGKMGFYGDNICELSKVFLLLPSTIAEKKFAESVIGTKQRIFFLSRKFPAIYTIFLSYGI